ncbi:CidA/LrgA family protein [Cohnella thailandensis]|uniref:CidA/LrgA family protein n=1 Tax=Cohnella thailandensis TaxID=557557 RepID=A0A841T5B5_9BACL|nr:CidA/LrgA family protein [Cohnella thailandensis]MBB6637280.1 CidA/LrgA family protein [Cohnella thailandensis]MBP1976608.1 holin-like protein [Cohnella thailandensis]
MAGIAVLLLYHLLGAALRELLHVPLPGNVLGMLLLTLSLLLGWVKLRWLEESARFLLKHMMLFFAPTIVGVIAYFSDIGRHWMLIAVNLFVSMASVLLVTGWTVRKLSGGEEEAERV